MTHSPPRQTLIRQGGSFLVVGLLQLLLDWLVDIVRRPLQQSLTDNLVRLGSLLPTGLFDNEQIEAFLRDVFTRNGRSNDFRALWAKNKKRRLPFRFGYVDAEKNAHLIVTRPAPQ